MRDPTPIYLDNGATTRPDPVIMGRLVERQAALYANPISLHGPGRRAAAALEEARERLAGAIGGDPRHLVFTGGGTEGLALALLGTPGGAGHIAISAVEHAAILRAAERMVETRGCTLDVMPVDAMGRVTPETLAATIGRDTRVVAIMLGQNEVGAVNDIAGLAKVVRERAPRARLVVDGVQAVGKLAVDVDALDLDCLAFTSHKLHGPRGIGALWSRVPIEALFKGGGHEGGRRGGTLSAPLALAFAEAVEAALTHRAHLAGTRDRLWRGIAAAVPETRLTGPEPGPGRLPHTLSVCVPGLPSEPLLNLLDARGVCVSAGSACSRGGFSRVLAAMGHDEGEGAFIRLTTGRYTTDAEVDDAAGRFAEAVAELRTLCGVT